MQNEILMSSSMKNMPLYSVEIKDINNKLEKMYFLGYQAQITVKYKIIIIICEI